MAIDPYRATPKPPRYTLLVEINGSRHTLTGDKCGEIISELRRLGCTTEQVTDATSRLITPSGAALTFTTCRPCIALGCDKFEATPGDGFCPDCDLDAMGGYG